MSTAPASLIPSPPLTWAAYAREVLARVAAGRAADDLPTPQPDEPHHGVFVTLRQGTRLRGCMGVLDAALPLSEAIRRAAVSAANSDPRFLPVRPQEVDALRVEVSVLGPPERITASSAITPGMHGVLVQGGTKRGLFLPQVAADHGWDAETLLAHCCTDKAGLPADAWRRSDVEVYRFTTRTDATS